MMALRLIEMMLQKKNLDEIRTFLESQNIIEHRELKLQNNKMLLRVLLEAEQSGPVLDFLDKNYAEENNRVVILAVEAALPVTPTVDVEEPIPEVTQHKGRISSAELYEDIKHSAEPSKTYVAMLILATFVAAIGLHNDSAIALIGAMVIAPMLGPSIAMSLGAILGDFTLLLKACFTAFLGIILVIVVAVIMAQLITIDPTFKEIAIRTQLHKGDIIIALASGCAGALAFTTGVSETLIGVMVAVSLLPPLVTFGLLLGSGAFSLAMVSLELFTMNFISINLASIVVFLIQGIYPIDWDEKERSSQVAHNLMIGAWILALFLILTVFKLNLMPPIHFLNMLIH
jgi:uncharacterized hydrophobic protein (TIGR00341 family)